MMLNRLLLSVIATAVAALLLFVTSSSAHADDKEFTFDADSTVILGQSQAEAKKNPSTLGRFWQGVTKVFQDDTPHNNHRHTAPMVVHPPIPTQPPKPPTAAEIQQAATPSQGQQRSTVGNNTPQPRAGTATTTPRVSSDGEENENDDEASNLERMRRMRTVFVSSPATKQAAEVTRQQSHVLTSTMEVPPTPTFDIETNPKNFTGGINDFPELPLIPDSFAVLDKTVEIAAPAQTIPLIDPVIPDQASDCAAPPSQRTLPSSATVGLGQQRTLQASRSFVSASPKLEFEFEGPKSAVVNQEITQKIWVTNTGDAPAEGVVVKIEIPSWIDVQYMDANKGGWMCLPREDGSGIADLEWKIERIDQGVTYLLIFQSVSRQHRAIEFPVRHDFHRPAIIVRTEVQEPKLEMELIGDNEVLWNDNVVYKLLVHNVGNGNADNIRLELQQTSSEARDCKFDEPLRPGETQELSIEVRAGREQEFVDIAVVASGAHDLRGEIKRRIKVLRPKLDMIVQTDPLHFVDNSAEVTIRVRNIGTADAENIVIRAELPLGAKYVGSSDGGMFSIQQQQNIVERRGRSIPKNDMQTFILVCEPQREGDCRVSVEANESNGSVLAANHSTFLAEAVVDLDLAVNIPKGPIELGQEVEYEVKVTNVGTKAAEDVLISMTFGPQLEPTGVGGYAANEDNGLVTFETIPAILPRQCVTVMVRVKADKTGTAPIRAEVVSTDASGLPAGLEKGFVAQIFSRRTAAASGASQSEVLR
jgi:hypothetical protein